MTEFLLVRHGTTAATGRTLSGWMNGVRLSEVGRVEVKALGDRLAEAGVAAIYTSPLDRTRETAALLGDRLDIDPQICEEAAEIRFGAFTGRDFADLDQDCDFQRWNAFRGGVRAPGGELMIEAQARMIAGLDRLRAAHRDQVVVVVSHADVIKAALLHFLGAPLDLHQRLEISPASVSAIRLEDNGATVLCINDTGTRVARPRLAPSGAAWPKPR